MHENSIHFVIKQERDVHLALRIISVAVACISFFVFNFNNIKQPYKYQGEWHGPLYTVSTPISGNAKREDTIRILRNKGPRKWTDQ
jgi:hypothetical protein